jgi:intraflagellar transport protein 172
VAAAQWSELEGKWDRAAQCWEKTQRQDRERQATRCRARHYAELSRWDEAARQREQIGDWKEAAVCWRYAKKEQEARRCIALAFETEGAFVQAAVVWETVENKQTEASKAWRKAYQNAESEAAKALFEAFALTMDKQWDQLARILEQRGSGFAAAQILRTGATSEMTNKDILLIEQRAYQKVGIWDKAGELAEELEDWELAAQCWQNAEEWKRAAGNWKRLGRQAEENECLRKAYLAKGSTDADTGGGKEETEPDVSK